MTHRHYGWPQRMICVDSPVLLDRGIVGHPGRWQAQQSQLVSATHSRRPGAARLLRGQRWDISDDRLALYR